MVAVATSIVLYAAPVWVGALEKDRNVKGPASVQRLMAIRVSRAYRMVDTRGVLVAASQTTWHLRAEERRLRYEDRRQLDPAKRQTKAQRRERTLQKWQDERSREATGGQWTRRLLPDLRPWVTRDFGGLSYYLTQALAGHCCFQQYLVRIDKANGPECLLCHDEEIDSVQHTIADCEFFEYERRNLREKIGDTDAFEGMVAAMLKTNNNWEAVKSFIDRIMEVKEAVERMNGRRPKELIRR